MSRRHSVRSVSFSDWALEIINSLQSCDDVNNIDWVLEHLLYCGEDHVQELETAEEKSNYAGNISTFFERIWKGEIVLKTLVPTESGAYFYLFLSALRMEGALNFRLNRLERAAKVFEQLIEIDDDDSEGARDYLPVIYILLGKLPEAKAVLDKYVDVLTFSRYNHALYDIAAGLKGDFELHVKAAFDANSWVAKYLLGEKKLPKKTVPDDVYEEGTAAEAQWYIAHGPGQAWSLVPGALDSLRAAVAGKKAKTLRRDRSGKVLASNEELRSFRESILGVNVKNRVELLGLVCQWADKIFERTPWLVYAERPAIISYAKDSEPIVSLFTGGMGTVLGCYVYPKRSQWEYLQESARDSSRRTFSPECSQVTNGVFMWATEFIEISTVSRFSVHANERGALERALPKRSAGDLIYPATKPQGFAPRMCRNSELLLGLIGMYGLMHQMTAPFSNQTSVCDVPLYKDDEFISRMIEPISQAAEEFLELSGEEADFGSAGKRLVEEMRVDYEMREDWQIGFVSGIGLVRSKTQESPAQVLMALVVDKSSGMVLVSEVSKEGESPYYLLANAVVKAIRKSQTKPQRISVHNSIIAFPAAVAFLALGIETVVSDEPNEFLEAATALMQHLDKQDVSLFRH